MRLLKRPTHASLCVCRQLQAGHVVTEQLSSARVCKPVMGRICKQLATQQHTRATTGDTRACALDHKRTCGKHRGDWATNHDYQPAGDAAQQWLRWAAGCSLVVQR